MSWAYSCLRLRACYDQVELITDLAGKTLLVDDLQLPYTQTRVVLDSLDLYNPDWWALGKIYAFHIQETPFIHVDGDVFIWEKFPERLEKSGLIAQNLEFGFPIYQEVFTALTQSGSYMPPVILDNYAHNQGFHAYNAGIIGGNDMVFFKEFSTEALLFIERNSGTSELGSGMINAFYEQHLYYCMAKKKGIKVECYTDYTDQDVLNESLKSLRQFSAAPVTTSYIHLFGEDVKKDAGICRELARRLRDEYPEHFHLVMETIRKKQDKIGLDV
jgi:hypothetical protein